MHPSPNTVARILATLAIAALLIPAAARGQTEATVWPHLTPAGFGLHIVGPGQSALQAWNYKPPTIAGATAHLQVRFLPDFRTGERIDVWVPKAGKPDERLPCIVIFYGGGWAGKVAGFQSDIAELVARGYVVAMPDYLLHAGEPVPSAIWDGARAIRWLRANAATYRIDPARIGVWGFSAGGWLVQYLAPSDEATVFPVTFKERRAKNEQFAVPMLDPAGDGALAGQPLRVQAMVSDWGAGRLAEKEMHAANLHWFGPDDPPLLTCHNVMDETPSGPAAYRAAGATVEICHLDVKNTHVPNRATPASGKSGQPTTWHGRVFEFFDEYVKHPSRATAPEAIPAGGPITGPSAVTIRCVHAAATIHYTVDGSEPSASSPECQKPLTVQPGQTLRTIAVVTGLAASPVATYTFDKATHPAPVIRPAPAHFVTKVGVPFHADFAADGGDITWHVCGRRGNVLDRSANPARIIPWLEIDARSGRLHGTPTAPGYAVVLVVATTRDGTRELADARQIVVSVEGDVHAPDPIPQSGR